MPKLSATKGKRSEDQFATAIRRHLGSAFKRYRVTKGTNLLYKLVVAPGLKLKPVDFKEPSRGQYAFQTDILISKKDDHTPLVVIELKFGGFNTHDVLTYSTKALKHKEIYPYLRYGFVVGGQKTIDRKFFTHNTGFDFALTIGSGYTSKQKQILTKMIRRQIRIAERLTQLVDQSDGMVKSYETGIILR